MFSHLTRKMKDAFHDVFTDGKRLSVADWQELLKGYEHALDKGYVSADPFPTDFKQLTKEQTERHGGEWRTCHNCGKGFGSFKDEHVMCSECASQAPRESMPQSKYGVFRLSCGWSAREVTTPETQ